MKKMIHPPKILNRPAAIVGDLLFVPTPPEVAQQTRPISVDDTNGKTLFDLDNERRLGFADAPNGLGKFAVAYQNRSVLEASAQHIDNVLK